jgi:Tol biopolymer transport system component
MRPRVVLAASIALFVVMTSSLFAEKAHDLYQQALVAERAQGDLQKAIRLYQQVVDQAGSDRALAVRALLQLGGAYEKLGRNEAKKAYQRILKEFTDHDDAVVAARERLAFLEQPPGKPAGSGPESRMVWAPLVDAEGEISPDGRYLSFVDWETGDMAIRDVVKNTTRRLTDVGPWKTKHPFGGYSRFSPDGRFLVYTWYNEDGSVVLRLTATDGSSTRVILQEPSIEYVEPGGFSPDGKRVVVGIVRKEGQRELAILSVDNQKLQILGRFDTHPHPIAFSPDGRQVLYQRPQDNGPYDLYLMSIAGGGEIPVAHHPAGDQAAGFSPSGDRILFISSRSGTPALWFVRLRDGKPAGEPEFLRGNIGRATPLGITRRGALYYDVSGGFRDGYIVELDSDFKPQGQPARLGEIIGQDRHQVWSSSGRRLAYVSYRGSGDRSRPNRPVYVIRDLDSGTERVVESRIFPTRNSFALSWSPDEKFFAVNGRDADFKDGIYLVDSTTGKVAAAIANPGQAIPAWSPDGKTLYYAERPEDRGRIVAYDLATGERRAVYGSNVPDTRINALAVSPNGTQIVFREVRPNYEEEDWLQIVPATGGTPRDVLREPVKTEGGNISGGVGLAFTPDGSQILFGRRTQPLKETVGKMDLWRVPAEGGKASRLGLSMPNLTGLALHPNGRRLSFTAGELIHELWVLENFLPPAAP